MIKANELRIGNWVNTNVRVAIPEILELWPVKIELRHFQYIIEGDEFYPIPLTPEILEGCGFNDQSDHVFSKEIKGNESGDYLFTIMQDFETWDIVLFCEESEFQLNSIKHLHQLQNLYFALTGEELTINLNVETNAG